jgi:hypothetical protein
LKISWWWTQLIQMHMAKSVVACFFVVNVFVNLLFFLAAKEYILHEYSVIWNSTDLLGVGDMVKVSVIIVNHVILFSFTKFILINFYKHFYLLTCLAEVQVHHCYLMIHFYFPCAHCIYFAVWLWGPFSRVLTWVWKWQAVNMCILWQSVVWLYSECDTVFRVFCFIGMDLVKLEHWLVAKVITRLVIVCPVFTDNFHLLATK